MKSTVKHFILFISLIAVILLTACQTASKDDEMIPVQLAEVTRSVFYAPQYLAIELGFFADEGLDVELTTTWGGDKTMTALLSDNADVALVGAETSIYVYAQEARDYAVNFAQLTQTDGTFLVAKEAHDDFSWNDVEGKSFLGQRKGGMPQMVGEYVLKKHDIDPHGDLDLEQGVDFANIPGAFVSGDYEYVQLFEPTASTMEKEGAGHVIASFGEESGLVPYTVFMAKQSFLEDNPETALKFTKAIYEAQKWLQESTNEEAAEALAPFFDDTELDMLAASVERYKNQDSYAKTPIFSEDGWDNLKAIMDEAGELPEDVPFADVVNNEFAEQVIEN